MHASSARLPCRQLFDQSIDHLLLIKNNLAQFFYLVLKMRVANFQGNEAGFHRAFLTTDLRRLRWQLQKAITTTPAKATAVPVSSMGDVRSRSAIAEMGMSRTGTKDMSVLATPVGEPRKQNGSHQQAKHIDSQAADATPRRLKTDRRERPKHGSGQPGHDSKRIHASFDLSATNTGQRWRSVGASANQ